MVDVNNNCVNNNNNILLFNENLIVRNGLDNRNIAEDIDLENRRIDSHSSSSRNTVRSRPGKSHLYGEGGNNCSLKNQGRPSTLPDFGCDKNFDNSMDSMAKEEVRELYYNQMYHEDYKPPSLDDIYRQINNNNEDDSGVDSTPIDFKRNFAAIDSASKRGPPVAGVMESPTSPPPPHEKHYFSDGDARSDDGVFNTQGVTFPSYWSVERTSSKVTRTFSNGDELLSGGIGESLVRSPDSHDSGIHVEFNEACVNDNNNRKIENVDDDLPSGWERCEDPDGHFYYWDVKSGTVQRHKPCSSHIEVRDICSRFPRSLSTGESSESTATSTSTSRSPKRKSMTLKTTLEEEDPRNLEISRVSPSRSKRNSKNYKDNLTLPIRFAVRSLGWTEVNEEDLKQDRSSRAVNKAIIDLSTGRKDLIDNVSKWGDGKELILELDDRDLTLIDPDSGATLHTQQIYQIRVWGVGRDNGRDFAYVARDRTSRRYMCHVFRCDTPARTIANTLRDICKRLMLERRPTHFPQPPPSSPGRRRCSEKQERSSSLLYNHHGSKNGVPRSTSDGHAFQNGFDSFPTPIEEPKKTVRCQFLGITQVSRATGIEVLNDAVDRLVHQVKKERWIPCDVSISPSTITITEVNGDQLAECRVRYLSFLGIGHDIKHCAFIMQSSLNSFMCYVFYVEPSAGAMAKTVEAACKLRYQKVLDAHGERRLSHKGWTDTIRDMFGSFTIRKANNSRPFSLYPR